MKQYILSYILVLIKLINLTHFRNYTISIQVDGKPFQALEHRHANIQTAQTLIAFVLLKASLDMFRITNEAIRVNTHDQFAPNNSMDNQK